MKLALLVILALMTQVPPNLTAGRAIVVFVDVGAVSTGRSSITVDLQLDPDHKKFDAMIERLSRMDLPAAPSKEASEPPQNATGR
jgi:hypothetical protein